MKKRVIDYLKEAEEEFIPDEEEWGFYWDRTVEELIEDYGICQGSDLDYVLKDDDDQYNEDEWYFGYPDDDGVFETEEDDYDDGADIENFYDEKNS